MNKNLLGQVSSELQRAALSLLRSMAVNLGVDSYELAKLYK